VELARQDERAATTRLQRVEAERNHGARAFVDEQELDDATRDLVADRATARVLRRGRGIGREL
jgi:hypothetical protein